MNFLQLPGGEDREGLTKRRSMREFFEGERAVLIVVVVIYNSMNFSKLIDLYTKRSSFFNRFKFFRVVLGSQ